MSKPRQHGDLFRAEDARLVNRGDTDNADDIGSHEEWDTDDGAQAERIQSRGSAGPVDIVVDGDRIARSPNTPCDTFATLQAIVQPIGKDAMADTYDEIDAVGVD